MKITGTASIMLVDRKHARKLYVEESVQDNWIVVFLKWLFGIK